MAAFYVQLMQAKHAAMQGFELSNTLETVS
jgi:hypothetical protein